MIYLEFGGLSLLSTHFFYFVLGVCFCWSVLVEIHDVYVKSLGF